ncbi:MAG: FMN-binding protein [Balneolaceae bacterium]|nr:FMN-binding protein [Balneolaceae bacterium]
MMLFCLLVGGICSSVAQTSPTSLNQVLIRESMQAVLGEHGPVRWKTIPIPDEQRAMLDRELKQLKKVPDTLYVGTVETPGGIRRIIPDEAPSRSETFSFLLYLDEQSEILDVDVLKYRENYGYEIDYKYFRKQFKGVSRPDRIIFGRTIQNISGATISARSITHAVHDLLTIYQRVGG